MPSRRLIRIALWSVYVVLWAGGMVLNTPPNMTWAAPVFLLLAAALAVINGDWRELLVTAAIGFVFEAIGLRFAYPFSAYVYTDVLAPKLLGVPVAIAGAWLVLFAYTRQMRTGIVLSALAMTALDLVIDPLASGFLHYWRWLTPGPYYGVPLLNFAGWFAVCLLIFAIPRRPAPRSDPTFWLGTSIIIFFAVIAATHAFFLVAVLGATFAAAGYFRFRSSIASTTM